MKKCNTQRFFDILFSSFALILLSPIFIIIVALLAVTGEKKIFYKQLRVGQHKKLFNLFKFATMLENSSTIGTKTLTIKDDPRILPFFWPGL